MILGNFESGGVIVLIGYVLITIASALMVRYFNKKIREQKQHHKTV
ncbi:MAG: hypothetical protein WJ289_05895 [Ferrovum myxofaciens]|nr:hypothetical protein [Ferrovum myxofaciens]QKE37398.1 MAG: hypothetical protein HO273_00525 [Ferrovum myxofaciens]QKE37416.1 MAG: hypothetical protein HO273_00615 [Ferrovum myxofaciens]QWY75064.1 MAG: hypothetical protein JVY19_01040 [Ferrovum myxofaciens]